MANVTEMTERLVSAALMADADDLGTLARMHDGLVNLPSELAADSTVCGAAKNAATETATSAASILEKIMLRDVTDATAALAAVADQIQHLQKIISGVTTEIAAGVEKNSNANSGKNMDGDVHDTAEEPLKAEDLPLISEFLVEADQHIESAEAALLELGSDASNKDAIGAIFRSFHTVKGVAGFLHLQQIGQLAHAAENLLDLGRQGKLTIAGPVLDICFESLDSLKVLLKRLAEASKSGGTIKQHEGLGALLGRLKLAAEGKLTSKVSPLRGSENSAVTNPGLTPGATESRPSGPQGNTGGISMQHADTMVRVSTTRLDSLINMVGELVIAEAMLTQNLSGIVRGNPKLARNAAHLGKISRELQDLTMSMRMVPIQGVFQKMTRLVRDLAAKSGKQIELILTGGETELDRNLVDALADPLVHMVRNSADHGIEMPADREKSGKSATGRIELKAYHQAGNIVVEITDDGKGLNKKRILEKGRQAGIVKENQELSEQDIFKLIFHAGLSTAEKITDVSGRGVGMDVVRRNVEALRGRIDIVSTEGKGSTFTIRLPLTLAVIDGLILKVGAEHYILPITSIEQSLRPTADMLSTVHGRSEMCMVRGRVLPLIRLHKLFGVSPRSEDPTAGLVVIVQDGDNRCCLLVDELLGQQQVVIKSLGQTTGTVQGVSGGAILGDGNVSLIIDVPGLMDLVANTNEEGISNTNNTNQGRLA
jgi:two-component system chemotaxis sensor kinase CheA